MKILAWCDAPTAPTGFGRSAKHILHALHEDGHEITQLAVNYDPATAGEIPWKVVGPSERGADPYGMRDLGPLVLGGRFDMLWTTFDPEVPWRYQVAGSEPPADALTFLQDLRGRNPGFKLAGWFPVDGGPLSDYELGVLGIGNVFDRPVTMSPHVYDLVEWTLKLRGRIAEGHKFNREGLEKRLGCIPHGVDLAAYRIPTDEQRAAAKERLGFSADDFVILQVERNQQRKQNYLALSVLDRVQRMLSLQKEGDPKRVKLFQHMLPDEENAGCRLGFNLPDLAWRYGLEPHVDVRWPGGFVSDENMVSIVYAAGDAFLSVSTGEGFQYPAWEALACGLPLVVPNADAREAWFGKKAAPNVHLYDARKDSVVMKGGYGRRMALPNPLEAARILKKMIVGQKKFTVTPELREAGRSWVGRHAGVEDVKKAWVDLIRGLGEELTKEREAMKIVTPGVEVKTHVRMINPGIGDLMMAAPALQALRTRGPVALEIERHQLDIAALLGLADVFTTPRGDQPAAERLIDLTKLYVPSRSKDWTSTTLPRFEAIAKVCGVKKHELLPFGSSLPEEMVKRFEQQFSDTYGISPTSCVGLAFETGSPDRSLPKALYRALHPKLKELGLTPVILGAKPMGIQHVGIIDLTGKTDTVALLGTLANLGSVVTADSSILHLAGTMGVPTVGCYSLFSPETRWCYPGEHEALVPMKDVGDESFPAGVFSKAGPGEWSGQHTATDIDLALRRLFGLDPPEAPEVILPEVSK